METELNKSYTFVLHVYPLSLFRAMTNESFENFLSRPFFFRREKKIITSTKNA